ncbi:hypothetical protein [Marispirochaeta aestuarii]|uniref:hypothetical protein n=1 Tax=Marispirochaeta aestuarii TaxID=1963862 RepID=UPI0029C933CC|nr:hypothetical protein [Marispirochaeta aestuarii]
MILPSRDDETEEKKFDTASGAGDLFSEGDGFVEEIQASTSSEPDASVSDDEGEEAVDSVEELDGLPSLGRLQRFLRFRLGFRIRRGTFVRRKGV